MNNFLTRLFNRLGYYRIYQLQGGGNCGLCGEWLYDGVALKGDKWATYHCDKCLGIKTYLVRVHNKEKIDNLRRIGEVTWVSTMLDLIALKTVEENLHLVSNDPNVKSCRESEQGMAFI